MRLRGTQHPRVRRTAGRAAWPEQEAVNKSGCRCARSPWVLTDMASAMKARGRWIGLIGDYDTASSCKAFHIDATGPFLNHGAGLRTHPPPTAEYRGHNIRGSFRPPYNTERQTRCRMTYHGRLEFADGFDARGLLRSMGRFTRYIVCHDQEKQLDGRPLTPITRPYCS